MTATWCRTRRSAPAGGWCRRTGRRRRSPGRPVSVVYEDTRFAWRTLDGRPRPAPLVRGLRRVRAARPRDRRERRSGEAADLPRASPRSEPIDFFVYADQAAFYDALGPGTRENVGGAGPRGHPDDVRPDRPERRHGPLGRDRHPPRADPPRLRHRRPQPVPLPAALAQRGRRHVPLRGVHDVRSERRWRPLRPTGGSCPCRPSAASSRRRTSGSSWPTRRASRRSTSWSARRAPTRSCSLISSYADGVTDDEAFTAAVGHRPRRLRDRLAGRPRRRRARPARARSRRPAGPLPPGWDAAGVARGAGRDGRRRAPRPVAVRRRPTARVRRRRPSRRAGVLGHRGAGGPPRRRVDRLRRRRRRRGCRIRRPAARRPGPEEPPAREHAHGADPVDPDLAGHALRRPRRPRLPHRRPGARRGAPRPLHDPGARAARRDRGRACRRSRTPSSSRSSTCAPGSPTAEEGTAGQRPSWCASSTTPCSRRGSRPASSPSRAPGLVLQLEDSQVPVPPGASAADYRVSAPRRAHASSRSSGWRARRPSSVNGERIVPTTAIVDIGGSVLVNSAYLAPPYQVAAIGPADLYDAAGGLRRASSTSSGRGSTATGSGSRSPSRRPSSCRPTPARSRCATPGRRRRARRRSRDDAPAPEPDRPRRRRPPARLPRRRPAPGPAGGDRPRDAVVAGPDPPRRQPDHAQRPAARRGRRPPAPARRDRAPRRRAARRRLGQLRADLVRVRIWSGVDAGVRARGPGASSAAACRRARSRDLVNELRNAGAEAISRRRRARRRRRRSWRARPARSRSRTRRCGPRIEVLAIGNPPALTGALTRAGGLVAQLQATYDGASRSRSRRSTGSTSRRPTRDLVPARRQAAP